MLRHALSLKVISLARVLFILCQKPIPSQRNTDGEASYPPRLGTKTKETSHIKASYFSMQRRRRLLREHLFT